MISRSSGVNGTYIATPELAIRPVPSLRNEPESWQARADLPWHYAPGTSASDIAMVSLHRTPVSDQALVGACHGCIRLGEASGLASEHDLDRLAAIRDMCEGATYEDIAEEYGPEHAAAASHVVGSFFGKIFKAVKSVATPVVKLATSKPFRGALNFVPGVGPVASMALSAASPTLRSLVKSGRHLPPHQRPSWHHALATVKPGRIPPHRHQVFTGPPIPL
jgi:hypothetical protein